MKKTVKILSLILCLLTLSSLLCSCNFLDEKKAYHITFEKNSDNEYVLLDGKRYRCLPHFNDELFSLNVTGYIENNFYLTSADVPVLLSRYFGNRVLVSQDKKIIYGYTEYDETLDRYCRNVYCEESIYDKALYDLENEDKYHLSYESLATTPYELQRQSKNKPVSENIEKLIEEATSDETSAIQSIEELYHIFDLPYVSENGFFRKKGMGVYYHSNGNGGNDYYIYDNVKNYYKVTDQELIKAFDERRITVGRTS